MATILRRARSGDSTAVARVHIQSRREAMPYLPELHSEEDTRHWVEQIVLPNQHVWVAERDDRIIGVAAREGQMLEQLYVLPGEQGRGVGSMLWQKALETADEVMMLWTFQRNTAARAFYERRGCVAVKFTDGAANEEQEPDVLYRCSSTSRDIGDKNLTDGLEQESGTNPRYGSYSPASEEGRD